MNDEIKINKTNKSITFINNGIAFSQFGIADEILDLITNLQQENQRLKELCDKYEEEHNTAFKLWTMKMEEMPDYKEKMNYKSGIDKAIEYITTFKNENERLNNIIDELEEYLIKVIETSSKHEQITCKYVLKYLRELKEGE